MISYLLKIFTLIIFSGIIIFYYYSNGAHVQNFDGYLPYIVSVLIVYGIYKFFSLSGTLIEVKKTFTPLQIFGYFLVHLLILSILFFYYKGNLFGTAFGNGITLFFKIISYTSVPLIISLVCLAFGKNILGKILEGYDKKTAHYRFLTGMGFGFFSFVFALTILGMLGAYNVGALLGIISVFIMVSYKDLGAILSGIVSYKIEYTHHDIYSKNIVKVINPHLLSVEFLFIIITLFLSVNLISVFRPFPIGWDDLGAYMNFPRLMAESGTIGELGGMMSWQTFTGIGYMFNNPTLAFYLNNVGGFLSVIAIILIISEIFHKKNKTFINLPLLGGMMFITMPMIMFQQAKDMKLDSGLFFVSIIALYMLFDFYKNTPSKTSDTQVISKKGILKLFLIIGLLLGFSFTIKFTSLLLISAIFGILFYARLGILGFLGFISLFISIFTAGGLWKMMNVIALDGPEIQTQVALMSGIIGIAFLVMARVKTRKRFRRFIPRIIAIIIGIVIAIAPWGVANISSTLKNGGNMTISSVLGGTAKRYIPDYSQIYSEKELQKINEKASQLSLKKSGITLNEDFGRYFGYEKGLNNYIKLPWNLTMQVNQGGEFTTIGFLFLALLPTLLLFLPFRKEKFSLGVYIIIIIEILLFIIPVTKIFFTNIMTGFILPYGYIFILLLALLPLSFLLSTLKKNSLTLLFRVNLIFTVFYTFLWGISAFGIVWYGIVMYFNFILLILFGIYYLGGYSQDDSKKNVNLKLFGTVVVAFIFGIYIFFSAFPYVFSNLKLAEYKPYKLGKMTIDESPFRYHIEYLPILFTLNIDDSKKQDFFKSIITDPKLYNFIHNKIGFDNISHIQQLLMQLQGNKTLDKNSRNTSEKVLQKMYSGISHPLDKYKNHSNIYRIGTFLKYHILENNTRLLEDSLLVIFDKYFYHTDPEITIDRMKKVGLKYLLVDLNAATIDKDPRHALTERYEKILLSFRSKKLELIETDSMCLKVALEGLSDEINKNNYLLVAGINYTGYNSDGTIISKQKKSVSCYQHILDLVEQNKVNNTQYNYLLPYKQYLDKINSVDKKILFLHQNIGRSFKVLFKIK